MHEGGVAVSCGAKRVADLHSIPDSAVGRRRVPLVDLKLLTGTDISLGPALALGSAPTHKLQHTITCSHQLR